jgi:superfamily I DNA/RNA helicase
MKLNEEQMAAVEHPLGYPACLIAGAGSGKTKVLTERVKWLLAQGVSPRRICAITFTNKAAGELVERLEIDPTDLDIPKVSTIHSLALSAIRKSPLGFGLQQRVTPLDDYDQSQMIRKIAERDHDFIADLKARQVGLNSYIYTFKDKMGFHRSRGLGFRLEYTDDVHEKMLVEHAGYHALEPKDLEIWERYELEKTCQPPGTLVRVVTKPAWSGGKAGQKGFRPAETKEVPIEELKNGDCVVSWRRQDGRTLYRGRPIKVASRKYKGVMRSVTCGDQTTRMTFDHWVWARFNKTTYRKSFVYLMHREGFGFRVGVTRFNVGAGMGLSGRMSAEGGEKAWILQFCNSPFEARCWEQIYSLRYGIPQSQYTSKSSEDDKAGQQLQLIKLIFSEATEKGGYQCLLDHGLSPLHPLLVKGAGVPYTHAAGRFFRVAACNLLAEYMNLPTPTRATWPGKAGNQQSWRVPEGSPIAAIHDEQYEGRVYSLDVDVDNTYVADGIVVGNCTNTIDFDDMLGLFNRRADKDVAWLNQLQKAFDVVLVDEAQDLSIPQWGVINALLSPSNPNLMAVGDISQSIMGFNGSAPWLLKDYSEGWRGVTPTLYRIARNHRSLPRIVFLANRIQSKMTATIPLKMEAFRGTPEERGEIGVMNQPRSTPGDIGMWIASEIAADNKRKKGHIPYKDNAILIRSGRQLNDIENALVRHRIPYVVRGGRGLLQTEEIRDILSYLRLVTNPKDFTALARAVSVPKRGVGDVALEKIRRVAQDKYDGDLIKGASSIEKLGLFCQSMDSIAKYREYPVQCLEKILIFMDYTVYLNSKYKKEPDKIKSKLENLDRFKELIRGLSEDQKMTTEDLVFQLTLERAREDDKEGQVTVSTIHSAKGLEWGRVYVTNLVEGSLPHRFSSGSDSELQEELRLLYVACTRARDSLTLCVHAMEQNGTDTRRVQPSRFLEQLGII